MGTGGPTRLCVRSRRRAAGMKPADGRGVARPLRGGQATARGDAGALRGHPAEHGDGGGEELARRARGHEGRVGRHGRPRAGREHGWPLVVEGLSRIAGGVAAGSVPTGLHPRRRCRRRSGRLPSATAAVMIVRDRRHQAGRDMPDQGQRGEDATGRVVARHGLRPVRMAADRTRKTARMQPIRTVDGALGRIKHDSWRIVAGIYHEGRRDVAGGGAWRADLRRWSKR